MYGKNKRTFDPSERTNGGPNVWKERTDRKNEQTKDEWMNFNDKKNRLMNAGKSLNKKYLFLILIAENIACNITCFFFYNEFQVSSFMSNNKNWNIIMTVWV